MKKEIGKILEYAKKNAITFDKSPDWFTVNQYKGNEYPRWCWRNIKHAIQYKLSKGKGFTVGVSFRGGWSFGCSAGTSDIGIVVPNEVWIEDACNPA